MGIPPSSFLPTWAFLPAWAPAKIKTGGRPLKPPPPPGVQQSARCDPSGTCSSPSPSRVPLTYCPTYTTPCGTAGGDGGSADTKAEKSAVAKVTKRRWTQVWANHLTTNCVAKLLCIQRVWDPPPRKGCPWTHTPTHPTPQWISAIKGKPGT